MKCFLRSALSLLLLAAPALARDSGDRPYLGAYEPLPVPKYKGLFLKPGDRLAICGDSITEQRMYSRIMETYLTVAMPEFNISVRQFGWSGERAPGFLARLTNDVLRFEPTIATTCYGMNDHEYSSYEPRIGNTYLNSMMSIVESFKDHRMRVVVGSPGAVGQKVPWAKTNSSEMNFNLGQLRNIGIEIAKKENVRFADVFLPMLRADYKMRMLHGTNFHVAGSDGVHPGWAGQTIMAYAFLKALGVSGEIGTYTVNLKSGRADASKGHEVLAFTDGELRIKSQRYPFCASGVTNRDDSIRAGMALVPFHQDLNRLVLVVKNGRANEYKISWGDDSKVYTATELGRGVNLAADFPNNPFLKAFAAVDEAVAKKQEFETKQIKETFRSAEAKADMEAVAARTEKEREPLVAAIRAAMNPVMHAIRITPQ